MRVFIFKIDHETSWNHICRDNTKGACILTNNDIDSLPDLQAINFNYKPLLLLVPN